jgi:hypothetical protein
VDKFEDDYESSTDGEEASGKESNRGSIFNSENENNDDDDNDDNEGANQPRPAFNFKY